MCCRCGLLVELLHCLRRFSPVTGFSNLQTVSKAHAPIQAEKGKLMKETPTPAIHRTHEKKPKPPTFSMLIKQ